MESRKNVQKVIMILALVLLLNSLSLVSIKAASVTNNSKFSNDLLVTDDYVEMLPGVFVNSTWITYTEDYNESIDSDYYKQPISDDWGESTSYYDPNNEIYYVYDIYGNEYMINESITETNYGSWNYTNYVVYLLVDNDRSTVTSLSTVETMRELFITQEGLSGDEILYEVDYYFDTSTYNYSVTYEYIWMDDEGNTVDPTTIIPLLDIYSEWASYMVENSSFEDNGSFSGIGFTVNSLNVFSVEEEKNEDVNAIDTQNRYYLFENSHSFNGITIFNDKNNNNLLDMDFYFDSFEIDSEKLSFDSTDYYSSNDNEALYSVWFDSFVSNSIIEPYVEDNEIYWSIQLNDIVCTLIPFLMDLDYNNYYLDLGIDVYPARIDIDELAETQVLIDEISFKYNFKPSEKQVDLKIDQEIGNFRNITNGNSISSLLDLSLAINYQTTTIIESMANYNYLVSNGEELDYQEIDFTSRETETDFIDLAINEVEEGLLEEPVSVVSVEFGGYYTWGFDNQDYDVGTMFLPRISFQEDLFHQPGINKGELSNFGYHDFYYASCYGKWGGEAIKHDPMFSTVIPTINIVIEEIFPWILLGSLMVVLVLVIGNFSAIIYRIKKKK